MEMCCPSENEGTFTSFAFSLGFLHQNRDMLVSIVVSSLLLVVRVQRTLEAARLILAAQTHSSLVFWPNITYLVFSHVLFLQNLNKN